MTSRRQECMKFGEGILVEIMTEEEAVQLLLKSACLRGNDSGEGKLQIFKTQRSLS